MKQRDKSSWGPEYRQGYNLALEDMAEERSGSGKYVFLLYRELNCVGAFSSLALAEEAQKDFSSDRTFIEKWTLDAKPTYVNAMRRAELLTTMSTTLTADYIKRRIEEVTDMRCPAIEYGPNQVTIITETELPEALKEEFTALCPVTGCVAFQVGEGAITIKWPSE